MRIAIDARELAGQPTGVGRYLAEILREWAQMPEARAHELVLCAPAGSAIDVPAGLNARTAEAPGTGTLWEQRALPRLARDAKADVLFCPAYSGPMSGATPLVVAIHDVSFAAHPEWFRLREGFRRRLVTRASARRAARILALTEFTRSEIVEHLGVPPDRIAVVYPGVAPPSSPSAGTEPRVLYVGSVFNRRHVPETIKGVERLARRHPEVTLTVVGDNRTYPRIDIREAVTDPQRIDIREYVDEASLRDLYQRSRAFVFLSEYEGFGLTPLEALAAGLPVVLLDTPVAREVFGSVPIYVPAPNPRLIASALETALFDDDARGKMRAAAPALVARYTWRACAASVLAELQAAVR